MKSYVASGSFRDEHLVEVLTDDGGYHLPIHTPTGSPGPKSPDGHAWGYPGSGPAQLALDLLWDVYGAEPAPGLYQTFKDRVIAHLQQAAGFVLTEAEVRAFVSSAGGFIGVRTRVGTLR